MMNIPSFERGKVPTAAALNASERTANQAKNISGGRNVNVTSGATGVSLGVVTPPYAPLPNFVGLGYNDSAFTMQPHEYALIRGSVIDADDWRLNHERKPMVILGAADGDTASDSDGHFCIIEEALVPGQVGRVTLAGCCYAYLVADSGFTMPEWPKASVDNTYSGGALKIAASGMAEILWRDEVGAGADPTAEHVGLIRFPAGGGGGGDVWVIVENKMDLPSVDGPRLGYVTSTDTAYVRMKVSGSWAWEAFPNRTFDVVSGKAYYWTGGEAGSGNHNLLSHFGL